MFFPIDTLRSFPYDGIFKYPVPANWTLFCKAFQLHLGGNLPLRAIYESSKRILSNSIVPGARVYQKIEKSSNVETILSLIILGFLVIIALSIYLAQHRYNPAVLQLDGQGAVVANNVPAKTNLPTENIIPLPDGIEPLSALELFDPASLSDKINGKAELYLSAGFVEMKSQRFKDQALPDVWLEMFLYDMGKSKNAFSVFSVQRRDEAEPLELTRHAYRTPNAVFLVHGPYYLEIIASDASQKSQRPLHLLAETFVRSTRVETTTVSEGDLFPQTGLKVENIAMIAANAFGFDGFDSVFTALYDTGSSETMAFVSRRSTDQEAADLAVAYQQFLVAFDGRIIETELPMEAAKMIEILDTFEIIFSLGPFLAGIREATDQTQAAELANRLYVHLKEVAGAP